MTDFEIECQLVELMDFITNLTKKYLHEHKLSIDEQKLLLRMFSLYNYDIRCSMFSEKMDALYKTLKK